MCSKIVTVDFPPCPEQGEADMISVSQTDLGVNSALWRHCRGSSGWSAKIWEIKRPKKKSFQDLHFRFSCMNLLLDLALIPGTASHPVRNPGSCGLIQKAGIQGEASQIPGCLDPGLGSDLLVYYVIFWGYWTFFFSGEKKLSVK